MNDLDDWLNSLGLDNSQETPHPADNLPIIQPESEPTVQYTEAEPQSEPISLQNISPDDFNDILAENGFQEPVYEEAEEVTDESNEEERMQELTPVEQAVREIDEDNALEAVQSVNEEGYPEHNPDEDTVHFHLPDGVVSIPIVHAPEPPQDVSDTAMEAFNAVAEQITAAPSAPEPLIPYNSQTLLLNDATSRFSGTEWYNEIQKQRVILAGLGGIGSYVSYNLASGSMESDETYNVEYDSVAGLDYKIISEIPTYVGYRFAGWKVSDDDTIYQAGDTYHIDEDHESPIFVAQWVKQINVNLNANSPFGTVNTIKVDENGSFVVTAPAARENYTFLGYAPSVTATEATCKVGDTVNVTSKDISLYGVWAGDTVELSYVISNNTYPLQNKVPKTENVQAG